ncbi:reverse transcriptase domain-containing protein [Sandaracinus amylolyticus]|uniref:reverse transcriptase domain-containing protein n=1 Tax=Sandaracinus amylolyticus TaxID=927083 RepID=UPI0009467980|nr:reverse transcriptase domain-containing protein [Sandaracinus amylolyticus]
MGVLDGAEYSEPDEGTAQGSILSPLLGNIYLHHVLDAWFEAEVKPRLRGRATLNRYADDFVICFERKDDAERVMKVIEQRMQKFGLRLHPDKTRLFPFEKPPRNTDDRKGASTFDFLGFTLFWRRSHTGAWALGMKTRRARLSRAFVSVAEWCRSHRHLPVEAQHKALCRRLNGHINYFGVNGNLASLARLLQWTRRVWHKWLDRRSQRSRMTWARFDQLLNRLPLPRATFVFKSGSRLSETTSAEEPDGGNLLVRFWWGPGLSDQPGLPDTSVRSSPAGAARGRGDERQTCLRRSTLVRHRPRREHLGASSAGSESDTPCP